MLYNICHVMLHNMCHVTLYNICCVIRHKICYNMCQACGSCATSLFLRHSDVICDLLLNRRMATWNLFVKYNMFDVMLCYITCYITYVMLCL